MAGVRHNKVATLADEVGAEVNKAEWNEDHIIDDAAFSIAKTSGLQTALDAKEVISNKGAVSGYASLTASTKHLATEIPFGSAINTVTQGNDPRLSDARTPLAHTHPLTEVSDVTMTSTNLNTLDDGVDSTLHFHATDRARANHTGTQLKSTISDFAHKDTHKTGGSDALLVTDLLDAISRVTVRKNTGADVGSRRRLNLIEGANITLTVTDDAGSEEVDVTITGSAGGSGTDEVLLVPTVNKSPAANTSIIVGEYYTLASGIELTIESGANLTVT